MQIHLRIFISLLIINTLKCQNLNGIIEQQPIFTLQPFDVGPLFSGARGIVQCTASGTPAVSYRWMKNSQFITNRSVTNGGVYLISQADRITDVGVYQCVAENSLGSVLSNKAFLSVAYMDQLKTVYSTEIRVKQSRAAVIKMPKMFDAFPQPTIEWFAGGALIEPNAKFAITKEFDLVVLRADKADEKTYYVEASSIHTGTKIRSKEIRLIVQDSSHYEENFYQEETDDDIDLEFVVKPIDTVAKLNDNLVKFDCIVNSRHAPLDQLEINWFKDQQLIDFIKTKYHLSARSLEIISVTDQDAGVYTCSVKHNYLTATTDAKLNGLNASARLDVYIKPTFKIQPENLIETDYGKTVQLKCEGIANPSSNITWYRNAQLIDFTKQTNIQLNESNTRLIINNISKNDQAIYQCFLSNEAGHISASTLIKIISFTPKFTEPIQNKTLYSDSTAYLSCGRVEGSPKPKITWFKIVDDSAPILIGSNARDSTQNDQNNQMNNNRYYSLDETNSNYNIDFSFNSQTNGYYVNNLGDLIIKNVNIKNQGWFRCEASNLLGSVNANLYLQIKKKTEIIEPPMNISVTKGQSAIFKCTVSKEDEVDIDLKWTFNDLILDLTPIQMNQNLKLYQNGTLQILEAKNTDIGSYKCLVRSVTNEQAGNDSKTAYLNVVELPYAPFNVQSELNLNEKRSVNLSWQSSFDGNSPILKYIVQARISTAFDLLMLQQQQQQYEQSSIMSSSNSLDWFVIKDNIYETSIQMSQNQQHQIHSTVINDLRPAISYQFRVSAVNGIGEGMSSRSSNNITIPEEEPSQAPQSLQADSIGSKSLGLKWQLPVLQSWNGRLKGYQIAYSLSYPNSTWKYVSVNDPTQTSTNLTDLIVWEIYLIKISAFNSKGAGKFSEAIKVRTKEGIPIRPPLNFRANSFNSTCIRMAWSEPPAQFVNGIVQGFKLIFYKDNQSDTTNIHLININQLKRQQLESMQENQHNYELCDLSKYTMYTFSILCFTNSGDGPATQPIQLQTLEDIPGEISDIYFNNVYDTSLEIEWRAPMQPNGRILSYVISYRPLNSISTTTKFNKSSSIQQPKFEHIILDSSQNNFTLKNLKPSTEYLIGIRAKTQAGDGQTKLTQIKSGVPPELPEPPKAIVIRTISNTFVELEFIPGFNGKTSISKWIVEALVVLNSFDYNNYIQVLNGNLDNSYLKWIRIYSRSNAPNATKLKVDNLKPFTNYTLRMYSQNVKGISKPSSPTELFQTLADVPSVAPSYLSARLMSQYKNSSLESNINILIKWTPIASAKWNGVPFGYVLQVDQCDSNNSIRIEIKNKNSFILKGLKSNECYLVKICAWNNVGLGPWTQEIMVINRTSESKPWRGPQYVNLYAVNSTTIKVIWSKLDQRHTNGLIIGYKLKYTPELDANNQYMFNQSNLNEIYSDDLMLTPDLYSNRLKAKYIFIKTKFNNQMFYETNDLNDYQFLNSYNNSVELIHLNQLLSFTNYKIEISGCTRAGCGVYSSPVSLKTNEFRCSKPINLNFPFVNLTSLQLEWHNPIYSNGLLKTFRIRYMLKRHSLDQNHWSILYYSINQTNTKHSITLNGLSKMEYYLFEISANNTSNMGWGEAAYTLVYTIDRRLKPDPPTQPVISKSSIKPNQLTLSWNLGAENYSPIRFFTIQMKEMNEWRTIFKYFIDSNSKLDSYTFKIGGKHSNGSYLIKSNGQLLSFRISATNDIGASDYSLESDQIKTKFTYPKQRLINLNAKPISVTKINLNWLELISNDSIDNDLVTKYKIVYKLVMISSQLSLETNSVEFIIDYKQTKKRINSTHINHEFSLDNQVFISNGTYEIKICPINQIGEGECSYTQSGLIYMEDTLPVLFDDSLIRTSLIKTVNALSSTELNVTWSQPDLESINGRLYAYKLVYFEQDVLSRIDKQFFQTTEQFTDRKKRDLITREQIINEVIIEPESTQCIINNLRPFTKYLLYLQVINQAGESTSPLLYFMLSNNSNKELILTKQFKTVKTFESVPSSPLRLIFSYVAFTYLNLTFLKPKQPNGDIQSYEIWYENVPRNQSKNDFKTKIIRQEIKTNALNYTLYINNLEPNMDYKFKVKCRTSIDWGSFIESTIRTGPQHRKGTQLNNRFIESDEPLYQMGSPVAPSRPIYSELNSSHSVLDWKISSDNYELFIIEIKYLFIQSPQIDSTSDLLNNYILLDHHQVIKTSTFNYIKNTNMNKSINTNSNDFELFAYTNQTSLIINKLTQLNNSPLFIFRVIAFNFVGVSEPSVNSDLIHNRQASLNAKLDDSYSTLKNGNQSIYSNWWFLVIIALSALTLLIIIILIMCLRGKNQKFLLNKKKRLNTMKMMRMNSVTKSSLKNGSTATNIHLINNNTNTSSNESNRKHLDTNILLDNVTSSDSNDFSNDNLGYHPTLPLNSNHIYLANQSNGQLILNNQNSLSKNALYELRKSKRGTIRQATYVSPNGTLSKVNFIANDQFSSTINNLDDNEKLNTRNMNSILNGFFAPNAQPNDYCPSNIGALITNNQNMSTMKSNNHYLIPTNDFVIDDPTRQDQNDHKTAQFYYGQQNYSSMRNKEPIINRNETQVPVQNFYTIEDDTTQQVIASSSAAFYDRNATNNLSNRKVFTTSSFGTNQSNKFDRLNTLNQSTNYSTYRNNKQLCQNTYYEHQQVYQIRDQVNKQPTYHTHLPSAIEMQQQREREQHQLDSFPSPPPVVKTTTPPPPPPPPAPIPSLNRNKDLGTATPAVPSLPVQNNSSSISISLSSGDRIMVNNTAGSRKPLTTGSFV